LGKPKFNGMPFSMLNLEAACLPYSLIKKNASATETFFQNFMKAYLKFAFFRVMRFVE
jgi:hypothetical protein